MVNPGSSIILTPRRYKMTPEQTSFLYSTNADFIAELYRLYAEDPTSVDPSWRQFFENLPDNARSIWEETRGASWAPASTERVILNGHETNPQEAVRQVAAAGIPLTGFPRQSGMPFRLSVLTARVVIFLPISIRSA